MTDYTNGYFEMMKGIIECHKNSKAAAKSFPFTKGHMATYRAWLKTTENESSIFEFDGNLWDEEIHDFIQGLKEAGITEFAITDQSTGLMRMLHGFEKENCKMAGLCKVTRTDKRFGEATTEELNGILIKL